MHFVLRTAETGTLMHITQTASIAALQTTRRMMVQVTPVMEALYTSMASFQCAATFGCKGLRGGIEGSWFADNHWPLWFLVSLHFAPCDEPRKVITSPTARVPHAARMHYSRCCRAYVL